MIGDCIVWRGHYLVTYEDEIQEFMELDEFGAEQYTASATEGTGRGKVLVHDPYQLDEEYYNDSSFSGSKYLVILDIDSWNADAIKFFLNQIQMMSTQVNLGLIYRSGKPTKAVENVTTEERDHRISFDGTEMAEWIVEWLGKRNVNITTDVAMEIVDRVQVDMDMLIEITVGLSKSFEGKTVTKDDVRDQTQNLSLGDTHVFNLVTSIVEGNTKMTMEQMVRLRGHDEYGLLGLVMKRIRALIILSYDSKADLTPMGISDGQKWYLAKEAKKISKKNAPRVMDLMAETDLDMKERQIQDPRHVLTATCLRLSAVFARA